MSNILRLAIVDPNDSQRESLKSMFLGMDTIWLEAECSSYESFADVAVDTANSFRAVMEGRQVFRRLGRQGWCPPPVSADAIP